MLWDSVRNCKIAGGCFGGFSWDAEVEKKANYLEEIFKIDKSEMSPGQKFSF